MNNIQNKEKTLRHRRKYYQENKNKIREYKRKYYQRNKDKVNKINMKWAKENPDRIKKIIRRYRLKNRDRILEYSHKWNREHPNRSNGNSTRTSEQIRAWNYIQKHQELRYSKCELCPNTRNLTSHHPDYSYPEIIVTCCRACHNWIDKSKDDYVV